MATRMWSPAASALRQRASPSMPPLARCSLCSQFIDTIHNQAEHWSTGIPMPAAYYEARGHDLYKLEKTLRERKLELDDVHAEIKSVMKRCVIATVGLPLLAWFLKTY